ncbi:MobE homing endonuclease [Pseudoalteromonas phage J2-1]|uniref:MobE homing endonuclease n=1 Tax=Pseudoalteromonas phage J2-1 TaxID=2023998 RepID=A0A223LGE4_9CAUD|nr:homing endonuclease [Pseudoalteromonas phage J2-1]ASU03294.1 MobE homing endonuclease [Pseudoalteromonas phage J2-1]
MGGGDEDNNLVKLTIREHCIAHRLLPKFVSGKFKYKMITAQRFMYSLHKNARGVESAKKLISDWKGRFLIIPKHIHHEPLDYFRTLNYYGYNKILIPLGSKEYYNKNSTFTYNRVRSLISKYKLNYNTTSIIFTEVDISTIGKEKVLKRRDLCQGVVGGEERISSKTIPCNTEHIGRFNNPVRYRDVEKIKQNIVKEVSNDSNYSELEYEFYKTVKTLSFNKPCVKFKDYHMEKIKQSLGLKRVSPAHYDHIYNLLIHLNEHQSVRLPRESRAAVMHRCVNMLLSTGFIKIKKGCKYYDKGTWLDDILIVSKEDGDEPFREGSDTEFADLIPLFKTICFDLNLPHVFSETL